MQAYEIYYCSPPPPPPTTISCSKRPIIPFPLQTALISLISLDLTFVSFRNEFVMRSRMLRFCYSILVSSEQAVASNSNEITQVERSMLRKKVENTLRAS